MTEVSRLGVSLYVSRAVALAFRFFFFFFIQRETEKNRHPYYHKSNSLCPGPWLPSYVFRHLISGRQISTQPGICYSLLWRTGRMGGNPDELRLRLSPLIRTLRCRRTAIWVLISMSVYCVSRLKLCAITFPAISLVQPEKKSHAGLETLVEVDSTSAYCKLWADKGQSYHIGHRLRLRAHPVSNHICRSSKKKMWQENRKRSLEKRRKKFNK